MATAVAQCPFNVDASGALGGTATSDGLIFSRFTLAPGLPAITAGTDAGALAAQRVAPFVEQFSGALDIDGDGSFTAIDALLIMRYQFGFRGEALVADLFRTPRATRTDASAIQAYIEAGCPNPLTPFVQIWQTMTTELGKGTAAGVEAAKQYMTDTAQKNYGAAMLAILADLPDLVASYSAIVPFTIGDRHALFWVSVPVEDGPPDQRYLYLITFLRADDGTWLIDAM